MEARVQKDLRLHFDGNRYCAPPHLVGQRLIVKADASSVTLYDQDREVVAYARSWQRGQTLGAERFEKELLAHRAAAQRSQAQQRLIALLTAVCPRKRWKPTCEAWPTPIAPSPARSPNSSSSSAITALRHRGRHPESLRCPCLRSRLRRQSFAAATLTA